MGGLPKHLTGRTSVYSYAAGNVFGTILVFDITDRDSFDALDHWYRELDVAFPMTDPDFVKILVGNKVGFCLNFQLLSFFLRKMLSSV
jgi:GTPase SAR1 family protein